MDDEDPVTYPEAGGGYNYYDSEDPETYDNGDPVTYRAKAEINVPIALSAFRDKGYV